MAGAFTPKLVTPEEGKTVKLFGVQFSYKVVSADSGGAWRSWRSRSPPRPW